MVSQRPVILGHDAVSPLGTDLDVQWKRALRGESGVGPLTRFPRSDDFPVECAGQVPEIDVGPYPFLSPRALALWPSPLFKYALLVVHRALKRAGVEVTSEIAPRVAVTFSTAIGGLGVVLEAHRVLSTSGRLPAPYVNPNACVNMVTGKISMLTGATGPILTPVSACATGSASLISGAMFLAAGMADVAICGAADCPLIDSLVAGFATMNGAYKRKPRLPSEPPDRASRPFSIDRRGFVISEGAGCIVLSTRDFAHAHGLPWAVELAGWATNADAHHFVAPKRETIARCMAQAIEHAGIGPGDIDAINAHAASTKLGDRTEAIALNDVFGHHTVPVTANKSQIGHAMGASSALETIVALESMLADTLPPTINYTPDPQIPLGSVADRPQKLTQQHVLKNAFGFGGCNACLVLRRRT